MAIQVFIGAGHLLGRGSSMAIQVFIGAGHLLGRGGRGAGRAIGRDVGDVDGVGRRGGLLELGREHVAAPGRWRREVYIQKATAGGNPMVISNHNPVACSP